MKIDTAIRRLKQYYKQAKKCEPVNDPVAYALAKTWQEAEADRIRKEREAWKEIEE